MGQPVCDRCGNERDALANERFWAGTYVVDGEVFRDLCDDCHRAVVRS